MGVRRYVYGIATLAAGVLDLIWGEFEAAHQPLQAFGDNIPGREIFAYIIAICMIAGGAGILWRRTARAGAVAVAVVYLIFAVFWLPRFYTAPRVLGFRIPIYIGVLGGVAQQIILVVAAAIVYVEATSDASRQRTISLARWIFGLCSINFGLSHLTNVQITAAFVPRWIPFGGEFWALATGICFVLAGMAILSRVLDVVAARLLGLMLLLFSVLALTPPIFHTPHDHVAWGSNAYNLAAVGAAWILADALAGRRADRGYDLDAPLAELS